MISDIITLLSSLLIGKAPVDLPEPDSDALLKFNLLLSQPNPAHAATATAVQKLNAKIAIHNRLLAAQEGITLVRELNGLQNKNRRINFNINIHFGSMPIDQSTGEQIKALGFTDIEDENSSTGMKKDIPLYILYVDNADSLEMNYKVEEDFSLTGHVMQGSSRISLTLFHELLHVLFFRTYMDINRSGHTGQHGDDNSILYEPQFINRIKRFREQIEAIERSITTR